MSFLIQDTLTASEKWIFLGLALLMIAYVALRPFLKKKDPLERPPSTDRLARQRSLEQEMNGMLVQFAQMARDLTAQLDTRAAKLELLIEEADRKIAALDSVAPTDRGDRVTGAVASPPAASEVDPRHEEIYMLADEGRSVQEIAQRLRRPSGEVELILALRPRA